ncbi:MAG: hypothetical protein QM571_01755 [Micrococcaceae bacterium]
MKEFSIYEVMEQFPTPESARIYFEQVSWGGQPTDCFLCSSVECVSPKLVKGKHTGYYYCKEVFTARTGTIFERSHVPLNKWILAMYMFTTARKGISSVQLAKNIGVTQKQHGTYYIVFVKPVEVK